MSKILCSAEDLHWYWLSLHYCTYRMIGGLHGQPHKTSDFRSVVTGYPLRVRCPDEPRCAPDRADDTARSEYLGLVWERVMGTISIDWHFATQHGSPGAAHEHRM